jgi:hypothetical protein
MMMVGVVLVGAVILTVFNCQTSRDTRSQGTLTCDTSFDCVLRRVYVGSAP